MKKNNKPAWQRHTLGISGLGACIVMAAVTCGGGDGPRWDGGDVDTFCRDNPRDCDFEIGGFCRIDDDCNDGICCRTDDCDNGMCTYLCDRNADCPAQMLCEDGHCFFSCDRDSDCGPGQECKHDDSVCQYD